MDAATIQLPGVDFNAMAREVIAAKLTEAMTQSPEAIQRIVIGALSVKVDSEGKVGRGYSSDISFVEWVAHDAIRRVVLDTVKAKAEALRSALEKAVEAELKRSTKAAAKALTDTFVKAASNGYAFNFGIDVTVKDR